MNNTAMGDVALESNTIGSGNVAVGSCGSREVELALRISSRAPTRPWAIRALRYTGAEWGSGSGGDGNTAVGDRAMLYNVDGSFNCAFGLLALNADNGETDSSENTAIGDRAGYGLRTGVGNVYIGEHEMARDPNENYHTYIHNINTTSVSGGFADTVTIDLNTGLLGHLTSSRRHKEDIKAMDDASETLYQLKPVTYRYKKEIDQNQALDYGLVAKRWPMDRVWRSAMKRRNRERAIQRDQRHAAQRIFKRAQGVCRRAAKGEETRGRTRRSPGDGERASRANRKSERGASAAQTADERSSY